MHARCPADARGTARRTAFVVAALGVAAAGSAQPLSANAAKATTWTAAQATTAGPYAVDSPPAKQAGPLGGYRNLVIIYQENHSFDNLYGGWGSVGRQRVDGLRRVTQRALDGSAYRCLPQNDVNLTSPSPLPSRCADPAHRIPASHFRNAPFRIEDYLGPTDSTCPPEGVYEPNGIAKGKGLPGGCTRDLVHRFYQEQFQLHGGKMDRYLLGSDAAGLTMGVYDTKRLPIYRYLHAKGAPNYVIADRFFAAAFGGSFLNHQFLIAARAPQDTSNGALGAKHSMLDANRMPGRSPLYTPTDAKAVDGQLTTKCADGSPADWTMACGSIAVNTVQPSSVPSGDHGAKIPLIDDNTFPNIGDRMNANGISWAWYSGGWAAAAAGKPGKNFQYHHQPFNYFANYAQGGKGRGHLKDEQEFVAAAKRGRLPRVSFVKPYGNENEHPGYASASSGSGHLVNLVKAVVNGPQGKDTLVVVTYDEFGGSFDHVAPPKVDAWGPGTRIPALILSAGMKRSGVDHTTYDTTSILATIERAFGLRPLTSRDARVADLRHAVRLGGRRYG